MKNDALSVLKCLHELFNHELCCWHQLIWSIQVEPFTSSFLLSASLASRPYSELKSSFESSWTWWLKGDAAINLFYWIMLIGWQDFSYQDGFCTREDCVITKQTTLSTVLLCECMREDWVVTKQWFYLKNLRNHEERLPWGPLCGLVSTVDSWDFCSVSLPQQKEPCSWGMNSWSWGNRTKKESGIVWENSDWNTGGIQWWVAKKNLVAILTKQHKMRAAMKTLWKTISLHSLSHACG